MCCYEWKVASAALAMIGLVIQSLSRISIIFEISYFYLCVQVPRTHSIACNNNYAKIILINKVFSAHPKKLNSIFPVGNNLDQQIQSVIPMTIKFA